MKCDHCGADNPDGSRYCSECYHPLPVQAPPPGAQPPVVQPPVANPIQTPPAAGAPGDVYAQPPAPYAQPPNPPSAPGDVYAQPAPGTPITPSPGLWNEAAPAVGEGAVIGGFIGARGAQGAGGNIPGMPPPYGNGGAGGYGGGGGGGPFGPGPITPTPSGQPGGPPSVETLANASYWQSTLKAGGGAGYGTGGTTAGTRIVIAIVIFIIFAAVGVTIATTYRSPSSYLHNYTSPGSDSYNYPSGNSYNYPNGNYRSVTPYNRTPTSTQPGLSNTLQVYSVSPSSGNTGKVVSVEIKGTAFQAGTRVELTDENDRAMVSGTGVMVYGVDRLACQFNLSGAKTKSYILKVSTPDGQTSSTSFRVE